MKRTNIILAITTAIISIFLPYRATAQKAEETNALEETVDVIAWFCNRDSVVYEISESDWNIQNGDTTKTADATTYVLINVTDSTKSGYRMKCEILNVEVDTATYSNDFVGKLTERFGDEIIGTSFNFETSETGEITRFYNLDEIKRKAKKFIKFLEEDYKQLPFYDEIKKEGFDIKDFTKKFNPEFIVDGFTSDFKTLFSCYGNAYASGETSIIQNSPGLSNEVETIQIAEKDEEGYYSISFDTESVIPKQLMDKVMGEVTGYFKKSSMKEEIKDGIEEALYSEDIQNPLVNQYICYYFLPNGWAQRLIVKNTYIFGNNIRVKQKIIDMVDYSFYNY